jgi:threonyl-tRNA synthetase
VSPGEGAFYGPKIDLHVPDALGRSWQTGTLQIDFAMPERFGLTYADADDSAAVPVIVHFAIMGSFERFLAILLEHCDGRLPAWLCPVQAAVIPIAQRHQPAAAELASELARAGLRSRVVDAQRPLAGRIRQAARRRAPFVLVLGDRELDGGLLAVRERGGAGWEADRAAAIERISAACEAPLPPGGVIQP